MVQIKHFFRVHIKQYSHFQRVTTKQEQTHFQGSYQTLLALWGSYSKRILHTFPDIKQYWHVQRVGNNTTHFFRVYIKQYWHFQRVANNTTHFFRVYIKQYWHFQGFPSKLNYSFLRIHTTQYWHFERVTTRQYWLI